MDTWNIFLDRIEQFFANPHLQIERFESGIYDELTPYSTESQEWSIMYIVPTDITFTENSTAIFDIRTYFLDLLKKDNSNEKDVFSDQLQIARDFVNWLRLDQNNRFNVLNEPTAIPVKSILADYSAGWYVDIEVEVEMEGSDCSIPFLGTQSIPPSVPSPPPISFCEAVNLCIGDITGPTGPAGPTGATGPIGPTGPQGATGPQLLPAGTDGQFQLNDSGVALKAFGDVIEGPTFSIMLSDKINNGLRNTWNGYVDRVFISPPPPVTGSDNVVMGYKAAQKLTSGSENTILGFEAGREMDTENEHTLVGYKAGGLINGGQANTFVGWFAGADNTSGSLNVAIGRNALSTNQTGNNNIAIGLAAGPTQSLDNTIAFGQQAIPTRSGEIAFNNVNVSPSAVPEPQSYLELNVNGTTYKVPLLNIGSTFCDAVNQCDTRDYQGGKVDVGASGGGTIVTVNVTFPTPFSTTPAVLCNASAQPGTIFDDSFNITTRSITTTGFTMIVNRVDGNSWGQDLDAFWMAFEY